MTTDPPSPRRKWHLQRWLLLLAASLLAYCGWTQYAFRAALKEAKALGWDVRYTDPSEEIRADWKAAFRKATWLDGVTAVYIAPPEEFEQHHLEIVPRLNPQALTIFWAPKLHDLSALNTLTRLQGIRLSDCTGLTNVDALRNLINLRKVAFEGCTGLTNLEGLKNLPALQAVWLDGCTGLRNVDALKNLSALQVVNLKGCTGLTKESVASLQAALPNTEIFGP